jgi:hypothetical protein
MRHACRRQNVSQQVRLTVPVADLDVLGDYKWRMTATECSRLLRERRASGKIVLTVVEQELAEIAHNQCRKLSGHVEINVSKVSEPFATVRVARTSIVSLSGARPSRDQSLPLR